MKKITIIFIFFGLINKTIYTIDPAINFVPNPAHYPIHFLAYYGHYSLLKELVNSGDYLVDGSDSLARTPLHYAALNGKIKTAKVLLKLDAEPYVKDYAKKLPEDLAYSNGHFELAQKLRIYREAKYLTDLIAPIELEE